MTDETPQEEVDAYFRSLDRASLDPKFLDYFYDGFMSENAEVRAFFHDTDMEHLKLKLKATLHLTSLVAESAPGTAMYLEHLGRLHHRLNIGLELYDVWLEALLQAVKKCDPEYDDHIEAIWRNVMRRTIEIIKSQYPTTG